MDVFGNFHNIAHYRTAGRQAAGTTTVEHGVINTVTFDVQGIIRSSNGCQRMIAGNERRMHIK